MPQLQKETDWKPKYFSEYSMGELDFIRFNDHLKFIEGFCGDINSTDVPTLEQCSKYFAGLTTLYKLWRPIIIKTTEMDNLIKKAKEIKRKWENSERSKAPFNVFTKQQMADYLDEFHTKLMEMKQKIGLGIKVSRNYSTKQKINMGMGKKKLDLSTLPEP